MYEIRKAYGENERVVGYDVFINGNWHERFRLLRQAKAEIAWIAEGKR